MLINTTADFLSAVVFFMFWKSLRSCWVYDCYLWENDFFAFVLCFNGFPPMPRSKQGMTE